MTNKTATRVYPGPNHFLQRATIVQMVLDAVTTVIAFYLSYLLWEISPLRARPDIPVPSAAFSAVVGLIFMLLFLITGTYQRQTVIPNIRGSRSRLLAVLLGSSVLIILSFFFKRFILAATSSSFLSCSCCSCCRWNTTRQQGSVVVLQTRHRRQTHLYLWCRQSGASPGARFASPSHARLHAPRALSMTRNLPNPLTPGDCCRWSGGLNSLPELVKQTPIDELLIAHALGVGGVHTKNYRRLSALGLALQICAESAVVAFQKVRNEEIDGIPLFSTMRLD
jgi:hypothetical protein